MSGSCVIKLAALLVAHATSRRVLRVIQFSGNSQLRIEAQKAASDEGTSKKEGQCPVVTHPL